MFVVKLYDRSSQHSDNGDSPPVWDVVGLSNEP